MLQAVTDREFDRVVEASAVPVLVEFWKPGCGHCQALMKELEQLQEEWGERGPVRWDRFTRMRDLPAHHQHQAKAEKEETQRGNPVLDANYFVVS